MTARRNRKQKIVNGICMFVYLAGVLIFALPDLRSIGHHMENKRAAEAFQKDVSSASGIGETEDENPETEAMEALLRKMQEYNQTIFESGQSELKDPWAYEQSALNLSEYGVQEDVIGILTIPKMEIEVPLYQGATSEHMDKGAVLLGQTSFPIDGNNSNSVIAAHRGWRGSKLFREIEKLEPGDTLSIQNYWETLTYKVTDIQIIMPDDIDSVLIQPGKNMVTLLTCHPYTKTDRRYVVFCEKTDGEEKNQEAEETQDTVDTIRNAELVRKQAEAEDATLIRRDKIGRVAGYIAAAVFGIFMIWITRRK